MSRKPRVEYAGAVYHVMNRGDDGRRIFLDKQDYEIFLVRMQEVCRRTGWVVHSYVLMPNHFHWLLETPEPNLVFGMKWFLGAYTQGFNARHGRRGHVFHGRYKALPVETGSGNYFEAVSTYIHLNPARARLLEEESPDLAGYAWSSYPLYLAGGKRRPDWLEVKRVLGNLRLDDDASGRRSYAGYMREQIGELKTRAGKKMYKEIWDQIRYGWCLGGEEFQEKILERVGKQLHGRQRDSYSGEAITRHDQGEAEKLITRGMKLLKIKGEDLNNQRKGSLQKSVLAWYIHSRALVSHKWICRRLKMGSASNLTMHINRVKTSSNDEIKKMCNILTYA